MGDDSRGFHRRGGNETGTASWVSSGNQRIPCLNITMGLGATDTHTCSIGHCEGCSWVPTPPKVFFALPSALAGDETHSDKRPPSRNCCTFAKRTQRDCFGMSYSCAPRSCCIFTKMTFKGHIHTREKPFPLGSPPPPHPTHLLTLLVPYDSSRLSLSHMLDLAWSRLVTALLHLVFSKHESFKPADDI